MELANGRGGAAVGEGAPKISLSQAGCDLPLGGSSVPACQSSGLEQLRLTAAKLWCDDASGEGVWRVLEVNAEGFRFVGEYFKTPRFQPWAQGRLWDRYSWRAALILRGGAGQVIEATSAMLFALREVHGQLATGELVDGDGRKNLGLETLTRAAIEKAEKAGVR